MDGEPEATAFANQLSVSAFLASSGVFGCCTFPLWLPQSGRAIHVKSTHQSAVDRQLSSFKQDEPVCNDREAASAKVGMYCEVQVPHRHIG